MKFESNIEKIFLENAFEYVIYEVLATLLNVLNPQLDKQWEWFDGPFLIHDMGQVSNCGCLVTWFCYQLIAKPGNKTATVPWPDPYVTQIFIYKNVLGRCVPLRYLLYLKP